MKCKSILNYLTIVAVTFTNLNAQGTEYRPAAFTAKYNSLQNMIKFPTMKDVTNLEIRCASRIDRYGRLPYTYCFSVNDQEYFASAVLRGARRARIQPAMIDGIATDVRWFLFSVIFNRKNNTKQIEIHPNHGFAFADRKYSAAQRHDAGSNFRCKPIENLWISVDVDTNGAANNFKVLSGTASDRCKEAIREFAITSKYIPAFKDAQPVSSLFVEWFD